MKDETDRTMNEVESIIGQADRDIEGWSAGNDTAVAVRSLFDILLAQSKADQTALKEAEQRIDNLHRLLGRLIERSP